MHRFGPERWTNCSREPDENGPLLPAPGGSDAIPELALRAEAFISAQGGQASEDLLVSHVFGSAGSAALWRPLLREVLGRHDRLKLRGDGAWLLADRLQQPGIGVSTSSLCSTSKRPACSRAGSASSRSLLPASAAVA